MGDRGWPESQGIWLLFQGLLALGKLTVGRLPLLGSRAIPVPCWGIFIFTTLSVPSTKL